MIWAVLGVVVYAFFLLLVWSLCIAAARADAADQAADDHADWLGVGSDSFPHDRSNGR